MNSWARNINAVPTPQSRPSTGNLYYVRLKTTLGMFYKLGFTTMDSVQARLAFQEKGDDELVDEVLVFVHRENAYADEQLLHDYFRNKAVLLGKEKDMPLYQNGQSELYADDILGLDFLSKNGASAEVTHLNVSLARGRRFGNDESKIRAAHAQQMQLQQAINDLGKTFSGVVRLYRAFQDWNMSTRDRERQARVNQILMDLKHERRKLLTDKLDRILKIKKNPLEALKTDVIKAIKAWKCHDLQEFERIVDINVCAHNVVKALTLSLFMGSDFMDVALSCNMEALCDAIEKDTSGRQLLLKPIEKAYKRIIREIVRYGRILSEEITLPDDPYYRVEQNEDGSAPTTLTEYYGPKTLREDFGENWTLPDQPAFVEGRESVSFNVYLSNSVTGFVGALRVRVRYTAEYRIAVDFPNYGDLSEDVFRAAHPNLAHYNQSRREFGLDDDEE